MYAVIETGGKQYKVALGNKIKVEKLAVEPGDAVVFDRVLMVSDGDNIQVGNPTVDIAVSGTLLNHGKGKKVRIFKMKRRKGYRKTQGHRQQYSEVEITTIGGQSQPAKGEKKAAKVDAAPKAKAAAKPKAEKPAESAAGDDLTAINGIGPVIAGKLEALGITTVAQIAALDEAKIAEIDEQLNFKGRIEREEWVQQAKALVKA